jgi:hypothetical protein
MRWCASATRLEKPKNRNVCAFCLLHFEFLESPI